MYEIQIFNPKSQDWEWDQEAKELEDAKLIYKDVVQLEDYLSGENRNATVRLIAPTGQILAQG